MSLLQLFVIILGSSLYLLRLGVFLLVSVWNRARQPECRRPFSAFKALSCLISENHAWFLFIMPYCQYKAHSWSLAFFVLLRFDVSSDACCNFLWLSMLCLGTHKRQLPHMFVTFIENFFPCYSTQHVFCVNALRAELQSTFFIFILRVGCLI
jgi:hypothetical protein